MKFCPACDQRYDDDLSHCPTDGEKLLSYADGSTSEEIDPLVGHMLTDRLRVDAKIGEGGMGSVYKGEDVLLGRTVAIKVLSPSAQTSTEDIKRFFHEARVVAKLRHPNTIQVFDFGETDDRLHYIAMEFLSGKPLDAFMEQNDLSAGDILEIAEQVCLSLEEAHEAGIIHRDLKPENLFIDNVNKRRLVKVIDFGIAKLAGAEKLTQAGMVFGTPAYMSPEQVRGDELDARSDLYSLGVVLFHLVTGDTPFRAASPMEVAMQHLTREPPNVAEQARFPLPDGLAELIHDLMRKDRAQRPASASEVRDRLRAAGRATPGVSFRAGAVTGAEMSSRTGGMKFPPPSLPTAQGRGGDLSADELSMELASERSGSKTGLVFGIVAGVVVVVAGIVVALGGGEDEPTEAGTAEVAAAMDGAASETAGEPPEGADEAADEGGGGVEDARSARVATSDAAFATVTEALRQSTRAAVESVVRVEIQSTPAGAEVVRVSDGMSLGTTPLVHVTVRSDEAMPVRVELDGYETWERELTPRADLVIEAPLRAETRRSSSSRGRGDSEPWERGGSSDGGGSSSGGEAAEPATEPATRRQFGGGRTRDPVTFSTGGD